LHGLSELHILKFGRECAPAYGLPFMRKAASIRICLFAFALTTAAIVHAQHCEPGSFLMKGAGNSAQLISQTRENKVVQDRFNRHFHTTTPELLEMFSHLHVGPLPKSGTYVVYNIHDDGVIRARAFKLQKGTAVFMDDSGTPILKMSCGNPMVAPVPAAPVNVAPSGAEAPREVVTPTPAPEMPMSAVVPPPTPEMTAVAPAAVGPAAGHVGAAGGFIVLPFFLFFNNHSSCCCNCHQPVPEPASLLVMGFGASCLFLRRRRRKPSTA